MKEIKLRIWDKAAKCWRSGMYIEKQGHWGYWARNDYREGAILRVVNHKTQSQSDIIQSLCSGLQDLDGVEVFQYDLLHDPKTNQYWEVVWRTENADFRVQSFSPTQSRRSASIGLSSALKRGFIVAGNVFEGVQATGR